MNTTTEYQVVLLLANGETVTTTFRSLQVAMDLVQQYAADGKTVTIRSTAA